MEYLMTYGWAILIIAVVLAALFELGVFNPMTFAPKASPGSCQVVRPEGAGTTNFISLEGECQGELPQYAASFPGNPSAVQDTIGQNGWVLVNSPLDIPSVSFTVVGWIYYRGPNPSHCEGIFGDGGNGHVGFSLMASCGYMLYINNTASGWPSGTTEFPTKTWEMVAIEYSGINGSTVAFLNGKTYYSSTLPAHEDIVSSPIYIGDDWWQPEGYDTFNGSLADVQFYNTTLSANDIQALYQEGIGGAPIKIQNLVGWWPLNGNTNDYSGNGNNGQTEYSVTFTSSWYSGYSAP
ncbi:MAG: LamG domain-containing protein [Candidatus Micrarchaeaceae archaeon]